MGPEIDIVNMGVKPCHLQCLVARKVMVAAQCFLPFYYIISYHITLRQHDEMIESRLEDFFSTSVYNARVVNIESEITESHVTTIGNQGVCGVMVTEFQPLSLMERIASGTIETKLIQSLVLRGYQYVALVIDDAVLGIRHVCLLVVGSSLAPLGNQGPSVAVGLCYQ